MADGGAVRLRDIFREARHADPGVMLFSRATLNLFAFRMTRAHRSADAVLLLELGNEAFPSSAAAHNDLGNAYLDARDTVGRFSRLSTQWLHSRAIPC